MCEGVFNFSHLNRQSGPLYDKFMRFVCKVFRDRSNLPAGFVADGSGVGLGPGRHGRHDR